MIKFTIVTNNYAVEDKFADMDVNSIDGELVDVLKYVRTFLIECIQYSENFRFGDFLGSVTCFFLHREADHTQTEEA